MKSGKVVLVLGGRFAGRKAIIVKPYDDGSTERTYSHALIAGIDKYPRPVCLFFSSTVSAAFASETIYLTAFSNAFVVIVVNRNVILIIIF